MTSCTPIMRTLPVCPDGDNRTSTDSTIRALAERDVEVAGLRIEVARLLAERGEAMIKLQAAERQCARLRERIR